MTANALPRRETQNEIAGLERVAERCEVIVVTAFDSAFFHSGLTLISQMDRNCRKRAATVVFDLGLSASERAILSNLREVYALQLPVHVAEYVPGYFTAESYGFKSYIAWRMSNLLPAGACVIWMDAGIAPIRDIEPIVDIIQHEDIFLIDHDDKAIWPFYNISFSTDDCIAAMDATNDELVSPHVRAGLFGFKVGGRFHDVFNEAYAFSLNSKALQGEKYPDKPNFTLTSPYMADERARAVRDPSYRRAVTRAQLREFFGFLGHRHDQAILSILAARHGAPIQSARGFCIADEASSALSKRNWRSGFKDREVKFTRRIEDFYLSKGAICMQHRGSFINHERLPFEIQAMKKRAVILGNGPSLAGFDFKRLQQCDVFGMNAAYR